MNNRQSSLQGTCCDQPALSNAHTRLHSEAMQPRQWIGWAVIGLSCVLGYMAYAVLPLLWPMVALIAWAGAYQTVSVKGCGPDHTNPTLPCEQRSEANGLGPQARITRRRMGIQILLLSLLPSGLGFWGWPIFWPLAFIAWWFGASFLVAAATGYPGCPEVGAIPSFLLRRQIATRCAPLERIDCAREQST